MSQDKVDMVKAINEIDWMKLSNEFWDKVEKSIKENDSITFLSLINKYDGTITKLLSQVHRYIEKEFSVHNRTFNEKLKGVRRADYEDIYYRIIVITHCKTDMDIYETILFLDKRTHCGLTLDWFKDMKISKELWQRLESNLMY